MIAAANIIAAAGLTGCPHPREIKAAETRVELAKDLLTKADDRGAEQQISKAEALDPENEEAPFIHAKVYILRARNFTNLADYENCLGGEQADNLHKKADDAMKSADAKLSRALALAHNYGDAMNDRAVVAMHFSDWDRAIQLEEKALTDGITKLQAANEPLARANLARAHYEKGEYVEAETELLQALQHDPSFCFGAYWLGEVYFKEGKFDQAMDALSLFQDGKACGTTAPVEALYRAAQVQLAQKDRDGAKQSLEKCITSAPKSCVAKKCETALGGLSN